MTVYKAIDHMMSAPPLLRLRLNKLSGEFSDCSGNKCVLPMPACPVPAT